MPLRATAVGMAVSAAVLGGVTGYAQPASAEPDIGPTTEYGISRVDIPGPPTLVHWRDCGGDRTDGVRLAQ